MYHSFCSEIATRYGLLEAILLNNMEYWIAKNKANKKNFHDGYYWTYNSAKAYQELFPYVSQRQIMTAMKHLREEGIIQTGNYNEMAWDRTMWYAFTDKGESIMQKCKMDDAEMSNGQVENVAPIPNINTDIKPNKNADIYIMDEPPKSHKNFVPPTVEEVRAYVQDKHYDIDPEYFVDYYTARGWLVGKTKMKDWRAAVRTWVRNDHNSQQTSGFTRSGGKTQTRPLTDTDRANIQATRELFEMAEGDMNDE